MNGDVKSTKEERNKQRLLHYIEAAWNQQRWGTVLECVSPDVVFHDQVREGLPPGLEGLRLAMNRVFTAMPDFHMRVERIVAEGDIVVVKLEGSGTHTGSFMGFAATGRPATVSLISMVKFSDDGKMIIEGWQESDQLGLATQIGMMPKAQGMPRIVGTLLSGIVRTQDAVRRLTLRKS